MPIRKKAEVAIKYPNWQHVMFDELDIDLGIDFSAVSDFREMWESGISVENIAKVLKRKPIEVVLLIVDQELRGLIKPREKGLEGL